jgi:hypothetical protein
MTDEGESVAAAHGFQFAADGDTKTAPIETHAEALTKEVKAEAADLIQLAIQDRKTASVRVVGVALFIEFEAAEGKTEMALGAAAGAAGSGYEAIAAALGPAMRALSNSKRLGFAHFGALAGVGKGQRASTAWSALQHAAFG